MNFRNPSQYTFDMLNSSQSNFNNAFMPSPNFIPQRDTKNYGHVLHNNINDNIVSEMITEYTVHVDSKDRNSTVYPNPYNFILSLGGFSKSNITVRDDKSGTPIYTDITVMGVPNPRVDVNFKNVKYIKLKYIMLPRNIKYTCQVDTSGNKEYSIATSKSTILSNYRYLLLRIKEISNDKLYSTNDIIRNDCFIIYRDSNYYDAINDLWFATQPVKIYYDNALKNLTRISIEILKPDGTPLKVLYNNNLEVPSNELNTDMSTSVPSSDFYNNFNEAIQTNMEFEIGVCENEINTSKNYR